MEPRDPGIDNLLRRSMAAPVPSLPPDFDQRVIRKLNQNPRMLSRHGRILLLSYGLISITTSAVVMRGQGLEWGVVAVMILAPLSVVAIFKPRKHA
jgi:hypothetical protein